MTNDYLDTTISPHVHLQLLHILDDVERLPFLYRLLAAQLSLYTILL